MRGTLDVRGLITDDERRQLEAKFNGRGRSTRSWNPFGGQSSGDTE